MLFYELVNQIKDLQTLESLSLQAGNEAYYNEQGMKINIDNENIWSNDIKCDGGVAQLSQYVAQIMHLKELDLNLSR